MDEEANGRSGSTSRTLTTIFQHKQYTLLLLKFSPLFGGDGRDARYFRGVVGLGVWGFLQPVQISFLFFYFYCCLAFGWFWD
jgi:hypothetical protein